MDGMKQRREDTAKLMPSLSDEKNQIQTVAKDEQNNKRMALVHEKRRLSIWNKPRKWKAHNICRQIKIWPAAFESDLKGRERITSVWY